MISNPDQPKKLSVVFIGAHPDDADIQFGGTAIQYVQRGDRVSFVSLTNGDAGHHLESGSILARRRYQETQAVAALLGINYFVFDNHDGELQATIENRKQVIQLIRETKADLIITHRPNDYHADHRQTSLLVQDAAYLICVPNVVPFTPRLESNPVIVYHQDHFQKPYPFRPEIVVNITDVIDRKMEAIACHESQIFEWIPFIEGYLTDVPPGKSERLAWLKMMWGRPMVETPFYAALQALLPADTLAAMQYVEAFERCEYGGRLTHENVETLFPFGIVNF